jgi:predicted nucleic acid-binding protein
MKGIVLDTGVLIALERAKSRAISLVHVARAHGAPLHVPTTVLTEWWRSPKQAAPIERMLTLHDLTPDLAKSAGAALAALRLGTDSTVDATVIALAAQLGVMVLTSDGRDFRRLARAFPNVTISTI